MPGSIVDVRSPSEFYQGHIPDSSNCSLFSDEERAQIGTIYKTKSRQVAIELGLELFESKFENYLDQISALYTPSYVKILCWRGGMRSGFAARLIELFNHSTLTLQGGYKAYRRSALRLLDDFSFPLLTVIGGMTGSSKTAILHSLKEKNEQVIDLEKIARHRGSAFGGIGQEPQPTQEQFENDLSFVIKDLDPAKRVWIEDESRLIGRCHLPKALYQSMLQAPLYFVKRSKEERLKFLLDSYGMSPKEELINALSRIAKRLGSELEREIKKLMEENRNEQAFEKLLVYYDKMYLHHMEKRQTVYPIEGEKYLTCTEWAGILQRAYI